MVYSLPVFDIAIKSRGLFMCARATQILAVASIRKWQHRRDTSPFCDFSCKHLCYAVCDKCPVTLNRTTNCQRDSIVQEYMVRPKVSCQRNLIMHQMQWRCTKNCSQSLTSYMSRNIVKYQYPCLFPFHSWSTARLCINIGLHITLVNAGNAPTPAINCTCNKNAVRLPALKLKSNYC